MSEAQALIDDIAAEYPELSRDHDPEEEDTALHHGHGHAHGHDLLEHDELADAGEDVMRDHGGVDSDLHVVDGQPGDMATLTDEALRQFANAAAMHYELHNNGHDPEGEDHDHHHHHHEQEQPGDAVNADFVDPTLAQVVSGSIPPAPRPTYQTTHSSSLRLDPADLSLQDPSTGDKRKRADEEFIVTEQPLQAQGDPHGKKHRVEVDPDLGGGGGAGVDVPPEDLPDLPPAELFPSVGSRAPPPPPQPSTGKGRKTASRVRPQANAEEMMGMTDGGGDGSDGGRKEGKDERSARRAEQNRRAQQNFRKRREEQMKMQEARLKELEPQLEALQRQQAETDLLLEALKLENTALRAVLVHAVKQGTKILDPTGELVGASTHLGLAALHRPAPDDIHLAAASASAEAEDPLPSDETAQAVQDVYAALDRLGARTHVYARTIVPLPAGEEAHGINLPAGPSHMVPIAARPASVVAQGQGQGPMVAQSSMRTVQHPYPHPQQQQQQQQQQRQQQRTPHAFPTTNLPPFPVRPGPPPPPPIEEEPMAEIDPTLENPQGAEGMMMVDHEAEMSLS